VIIVMWCRPSSFIVPPFGLPGGSCCTNNYTK